MSTILSVYGISCCKRTVQPVQSGAGGPYVAVLNSLLEGRPLDVALPGADLAPTAAPPH